MFENFYGDNTMPQFRCARASTYSTSPIVTPVQEFQGIGMEEFDKLYDALLNSRLRY
jgi:hypothetical protein